MNEKEQDELTALLRDVSVPADLKERLWKIAQDDALPAREPGAVEKPPDLSVDFNVALQARNRSPGRRHWQIWAMVLAACTIGTLVMLNWPRENREQPELVRDGQPVGDPNGPVYSQSSPEGAFAAAEALKSYDEAIRQLDFQLATWKVDRIESELARVRRQNARASVTASLSAIDDLSARLALARLAARDFGASDEVVREDVNRIMLDFPQSLGSELAAAALSGDFDLNTIPKKQ